jgi:hypothetical protein
MLRTCFHFLLAALGAVSTAPAQARVDATANAATTSALDALRAATRRFQNLDSAAAAGYVRDVADCVVHEHHGAMGYHHANRALNDAKVETEHPEILLYERTPDGVYRLNGVEYIVPYRAWPRDSIPPIALGQRMKHEDNLQIWYLHVWAWTDNTDGLFADFNPSVQCPASASKVFRPFVRP